MVSRRSATRGRQLTSDRSVTRGEAGRGNGVGVEEEDWVRTEIIVQEFVGERNGGRERGECSSAYIEILGNGMSTGRTRNP